MPGQDLALLARQQSRKNRQATGRQARRQRPCHGAERRGQDVRDDEIEWRRSGHDGAAVAITRGGPKMRDDPVDP